MSYIDSLISFEHDRQHEASMSSSFVKYYAPEDSVCDDLRDLHAHHGDYCTLYVAREVDAALAAKDRDLQEAAHNALMLEASAAAFQRVAEQRQADNCEMRELLRNIVSAWTVSESRVVPEHWIDEACELIKRPTTGASNG